MGAIGFSYITTISGKRQHYLWSTTVAGPDPSSAVHVREPETLHPPLASVEV